MRFLVRMLATDTTRESFLASSRALARSVGADARNPKWTSYGALEIDIFCPTKGDFDLFLSVIRPLARIEFHRDLNVAPPHKPEAKIFEEARDYFNAERYWECHEALEGVWRLKHGDEKRFLQGVILICAAFVHHQKGENQVAMGVLRRAIPLLQFPSETYGGVAIGPLKRSAQSILDEGRFSNFRV